MHRGSIVEAGSPTAIFQNPAHPYTQALVSAMPGLRDARYAGLFL
jgi:oligopeptide/dipeptide ABC transporter ATP-binding protein